MGFPKEAPEIAIQGFTNSPENDVLAEKRLRRAKTNVDNHNNNDFLAKMSHLNFGIRKQLISEVNCIFIPSQNVNFYLEKCYVGQCRVRWGCPEGG